MPPHNFLLVILSITGICLAEELQTLILSDQVEGNVTLMCVGSEPLPSCIWIKNGKQITSVDKYGDLSACNLTIFGVESEDEGKWMCGIMNRTFQTLSNWNRTFLTLSNEVTIRGNSKPTSAKREFITKPETTYPLLGTDAIMDCTFNTSSPHCFWTKNSNIIAITGRYSYIGDRSDGNCTIKITKTRVLDNGDWQCGYPETDSESLILTEKATVFVSVMPAEPVILVNNIPMRNGSKLYISKPKNTNLEISCWSENGSPASSLQWIVKSDWRDYKYTFPQNDASYQTKTFENIANSPLEIATLLLDSQKFDWEWQHYYLICSAFHPTYEKNHTTSVQLVLGYGEELYQKEENPYYEHQKYYG